MSNTCKIRIEAHFDCDDRIGQLYRMIGKKAYHVQINYDYPSFSEIYMAYDQRCFQWILTGYLGEIIKLKYVDSNGQSYKITVNCNEREINYLLCSKEHHNSQKIIYSIYSF